MRSCFASILTIVLVASATIHSSSTFAQEPPPGPIEIELPIGDVHLRYDETLRGMMFTITSGPIVIRARRVYIGDGTKAVKFEASNAGMKTPLGVVNKAAIKIEDGETIPTVPAELFKWGSKSKEVYLLVPNLKLVAKSNEDSQLPDEN
jgi:hypothetical protein